MGLFTSERKVPVRTSLVIFALGVLIPLTLMLLRVDGRIVFSCALLTPLVWSVVWRDLGFVLGFFFFWGAVFWRRHIPRPPMK
ncbi:MAG: hypothetical protein KDA66_10685, partial [Planctomycetaceae bacterium]|nr:hypothetical protein [Planctomycetaceae bacterium]